MNGTRNCLKTHPSKECFYKNSPNVEVTLNNGGKPVHVDNVSKSFTYTSGTPTAKQYTVIEKYVKNQPLLTNPTKNWNKAYMLRL